MKFSIYVDELYPYFGLATISDLAGEVQVELTPEAKRDYDEVMGRFENWQSFLDKEMAKQTRSQR